MLHWMLMFPFPENQDPLEKSRRIGVVFQIRQRLGISWRFDRLQRSRTCVAENKKEKLENVFVMGQFLSYCDCYSNANKEEG